MMNVIEFQEKYGTEEQCREYLLKKRWPKGFVCPKCYHSEYFNVQSRNLFQCKACNHQVSVTAGTIMDKTRTPLAKWFLAFFLMAEDRSISSLMLAKRIGVAYYTAWTIRNKIRYMLGTRNIFTKPSKQQYKKSPVSLKRGRKKAASTKKSINYMDITKD